MMPMMAAREPHLAKKMDELKEDRSKSQPGVLLRERQGIERGSDR